MESTPRRRPLWVPVLVVLGLFVVMLGIFAAVPKRGFPTATPARYETATYEQALTVADTYGSRWQAQALLDLMSTKPNGSTYRIVATSPSGETVTLTVDYTNGTLARRHVDKAGKSSTETWKGDLTSRIRNTAAGGTFNDT